MEKKVCPYPGLRPFTENESIFFKGREVHIRQIIRQLEEKKFVMITGASGDGKSSLVYAGVIPNARAGFFRAKYNNWLITDFRPERKPLENLAESLSKQLELDYDFVEEELSYGFSALVSLYKESKFYLDYNSNKWKNANDKEKKKLKQEAANLFILADQFEEFFTNTENFNNNKPSSNAYTTINLLLETARIAAAEDLPIYIAFTMRSDYISQSVSFKGLPEFIGFSQFFVPRLKRNELQQIIEEPAILSGGKVSKSLSEKLINDLPNGFDQLPLLQHIMNRLWKYAADGDEELGLLHLTKIAGMPPKNLKIEEREHFDKWLLNIEDFRQAYYDKPVLTNVLNTHANILYETAFDYFTENTDWASQNITKEEAQYILKVSFKSLTKIDEGRAVRNRMTLREITQIINKPHITYETVCGVLNIYRLQDSTFIRPFIDDNDVATKYLSADDTFDITHEALIRNWNILKDWELEETENISNLKDFKIQLNRWISNGKSNKFLLAAGSLAYFQDWYEKSEPNKYWIAKYDSSSFSKEQKLEKAEALSNNIIEFLSESKKYLLAIRAKQRRLRTILLIAAAIIIVILSGVVFFAQQAKEYAEEQTALIEQEKKEAENQKLIAEEQTELALKAQAESEKAKKRAELSAYEAMKAKLYSDSAKTDAEKMRRLAELSSEYAKQEAENAKIASNKADEMRVISEEERKKAELASKRARKLSYLAMAQSLALRSKQNYNDEQINLLLAYQAYLFNKEHGGSAQDPEIYKALNSAILNAGEKNTIPLENKNFTSFQIKKDNNLSFISKDGEIQTYSSEGGAAILSTSLNSKLAMKEKIPINSSYFIDEENIAIGLEDKSVMLWNTETKEKQKLNNYKNYIRGAIQLKDGAIAIVDRSPSLKIWNVNESSRKEIKEIEFDSRINKLLFIKLNNSILVALNNGNLVSINLLNFKQTLISVKKARVTSLALSESGKLLVAGYSNGVVEVFNVDQKITFKSILYASPAGVSDLAFNEKSDYLAVATNDKRINLFETNSLETSPITINDHDQNVKSIRIKNQKLYALCDDNSFRYWELSLSAYAEKVKSLIIRDLTEDEWTKFIGENIKP